MIGLKFLQNDQSTPAQTTSQTFHPNFGKNRFVSINGPDAYQKAKEFIEDYNRKSESKIASITQLESGSVVVAVVDEFSKRVHKTIVESGQICFVDGTSSLDRMNHQLIKLMTESPSGDPCTQICIWHIWPYLACLGAYLGARNMVKWGVPEKILQNAVQTRWS